jgi:hypothetical protein
VNSSNSAAAPSSDACSAARSCTVIPFHAATRSTRAARTSGDSQVAVAKARIASSS